MNCPVCQDVQLQMAERQGVEIDYCPKCRGLWLDRGELDKILERSGKEPQEAVRSGREPREAEHSVWDKREVAHAGNFPGRDSGGHRSDEHDQYGKRKKRWYEDILDF